MKRGRPQKTQLVARWQESRKRWMVDVPASWDGKRKTFFFESQLGALNWINERQKERFLGLPLPEEHRLDEHRTVAQLVKAYLGAKSGLSSHRLVSNHLGKFLKRFGVVSLENISPLAAKLWIESLPHAERTRFGVFSTCRSFATWAVRYGFAANNPFEVMEAPPKGDPPKVILTVQQMSDLLGAKMLPYMRSWIVLGGFAGIRTEEIARMDWGCVRFEESEIHVPRTAIKRTTGGMRERYVAMLPAFIRHCRTDGVGKILPVSKTTFHSHATALAAKVLGKLDGWPHNALRHSFASYHLAMWEDASKTSHQMGHTNANMVHQNYARAVRKADAVRWWAL